MLRNLVAIFMLLASVSTITPAHGQELLATIYAELVTTVVVILGLLLIPNFRPHWKGGTWRSRYAR